MLVDVSEHDRDILRRLAGRVREIADDASMPERKRRWKQHNALRSERPMVVCFPEGSWQELLPHDQMQCRDPFLRQVERNLATTVYWWEHIRDDQAIDPWYNALWCIEHGDYGVEIPRHQGDNRGSFVWDPPIRDLEADFPKLKQREPKLDREQSLQRLELLSDLFGDLLPVRLRHRLWWTMGLAQTLVYLIGLEQMMLAMFDQPEALHRIMRFLHDDMLNLIQWAQREHLLFDHNESDYVGSGGQAYTDELPANGRAPDAPARLSDMWGFGESQETVGISPDMFEQFIMPYQKPLLEHFGLNCYGCCEPLETRIAVVKREVPRLRRVSVAPMANQEKMAAALGGDYIFSRKPDPVPVCVEFDEKKIRNDLRYTLDVTRGMNVELIMKDTHTVQNEPWRITRWIELAYEEVDKV